MGASGATSTGIGIGGALGGMAAAGRTKRSSDRALRQGQLGESFQKIQQLLQPYNGGPSQLAIGLSGYEKSLEDADPVFAAYKKTIMEGLNTDENGLPADFARQLTETTRGAQAARGVLESDTSAIQEAVALMGGREAVRARRLGDVKEYLGGVLGGGLEALMPTIKDIYGGELQRAIETAKGRRESAAIGAGIYGSTAS